MSFIRYFADEINRAVPIREALMYYMGMETGGKNQIRCPSPDHDDKNPSAFIYDRSNTCRCFSCQTSFSPISLVMLSKGYTNRDFPKACMDLIHDFGLNPSLYMEIDKEDEKANDFPLSLRELKLIGLAGALSDKSRNPLYEHEFINPANGEKETVSIGDKYLKTPNIYGMWKNDRQACMQLILNKCEDFIEKETEYAELLSDDFTELYQKKDKGSYWDDARNTLDAYRKFDRTYKTALTNSVIEYINDLEYDGIGVSIEVKRAVEKGDLQLMEEIAGDVGLKVPLRPVLSGNQRQKCMDVITLENLLKDYSEATDTASYVERIKTDLQEMYKKEFGVKPKYTFTKQELEMEA